LKRVAGYTFDERDATSVLYHAERLRGKTIGEIAAMLGRSDFASKLGKGRTGQVVQGWFGITFNDNRAEPDLPIALVPGSNAVGLEIKIVPMTKRARNDKLRTKERNVIGMIDYKSLPTETWSTAAVRHKIEHILFIFYLYDFDDWLQSKILDVGIWSLSDEPRRLRIAEDWQHIHDLVAAGKAHELHEGDEATEILRTCRKGPGGSEKRVAQPRSDEPAWRRAYSLAPGYLDLVWLQRFERVPLISLLPDPNASTDAFQKKVLDSLATVRGKKLRELDPRRDWSKPMKNAAALVVSRALDIGLDQVDTAEFIERRALRRVVPVSSKTLAPEEAVSFPTMRLKQFADETWETSQLLSYLSLILFIPTLVRPGADQGERRIGRSFFWSPSQSEWNGIRAEWLAYQRQVISGACKTSQVSGGRHASSLAKESETEYIHMRPHGKDGSDFDIDPVGNRIVKQSFWLNKRFIKALLEHHNATAY
jgi:DNA mismatch repair protein MutH